MNLRSLKAYIASSLLGMLTGALVLGVGGRLLMRLIARLGGLQGGFSWGGSGEVVLLGLITGAIAGLFYPLWRRIPGKKLLNGTLYGLLIFIAFLILPIDGKGAARGFPDLSVLIYLGFGLLFLLFGVILTLLYPKFMGKQ